MDQESFPKSSASGSGFHPDSNGSDHSGSRRGPTSMTPQIKETSWLDFLKGGLEATPELGGFFIVFIK
jgi:hypothetical protein